MPSTVEASEEFTIAAPLERVWSFFTDLSNVGSCIPGCETVNRIDSETASFKVKVKVGYISRSFEIRARFKELIQPTHVSFFGEGSDAEISGNLDLTQNPDSVAVKYRIEIRPVSVMGKTSIAMIGKDLVKKQASEFASCVKSRLERA
ncbi:MAG TPA: SRPBCC domain-containing protein [Nitrososphaerales archaeon]|nr:SRPBCC domain-containing protein [Nitrososphaerales archaeon]